MNNKSTIQEESIKQFFTEANIEVDSDFIAQFLYNRTHKDTVSSEWLYAWYKSTGYKSTYNNFCVNVIKKLPNSEY